MPREIAESFSERKHVPRERAQEAFFSDLFALTKPRITLMVLTTTYGGLWLARRSTPVDTSAGSNSIWTLVFTLLGTFLIVAGANALNMYVERDVDRRMDRTKN